MNEEATIDQIKSHWPRQGEPPSGTLIRLVETAVQQHPSSSELWMMYGNLLLVWDDNPSYSTDQTISVFRKVLELDPGCWEAYQEIGFLYDTYLDDFVAAEAAFRTAIALGGEVNCYCGLARVLAQRGLKHESLDVLSGSNCPFGHLAVVDELRAEIRNDVWNK